MTAMRIAVIGQGYVGVTGAVALAQGGHQVTGVEQDAQRLAALREGRAPVFEPGLQEELSLALATGRLRFARSVSPVHAEEPFDVVMVAVGTPPGPDGSADLSQVTAAVQQVTALVPAPLLVLKSTVPPGTSEMLLRGSPGLRDRYAYNPEFLNQGSALEDWLAPSRVVVGVADRRNLPLLRQIHGHTGCPWVVTTPTSAEMVKYASNAFLATKISFANEIARLCAGPEFHVDQIMQGVGSDPRIGHAFLQPGLGFGDSCLPKDTAALANWAAARGIRLPLLHAVREVNEGQPGMVAETLRRELGTALSRARIAVLGVRYEPWSDDLRAAPSRTVIPGLMTEVAEVRVWDPEVDAETVTRLFPGAVPSPDLPSATDGAHAVVILTEWPEIIEADWASLTPRLEAPRLIIDGKNCLYPGILQSLPLLYRSTGNRFPLPTPTPAQLEVPPTVQQPESRDGAG
ncbi:UDP-glucose 6-dehydrogenase [Streptomyces mashuensis]|uniref:UDP-glucose 6-dehydrogenase n=1 Tax=Streptomyces mashuensis TaxID=33904 RepID=A0A919B1N4_9ACTN|nr:UDP-glucose/GDP-mannose dehydrogenase family protein [Streptomyces mashuensis]GHF35304.1 UDP-glucose 6-dehydrogenase [Streptomyces mashuensis]